MSQQIRNRQFEPRFNRVNSVRLQIVYRLVEELKASPTQLRRYQKRHREHLLQSIRKNDLILPILIDKDDGVVHGSQLLLAAKDLGCQEVPTVKLHHLSKEEVRALRIALHKLEELSSWDEDVLRTLCAGSALSGNQQADLSDRNAILRLLQNEGDLRLRKLARFHGTLLGPNQGS